jgi:FkbM family methyltransferase
LLQNIKDYLVGLGPDNRLTQLALSLHARRQGFKVDFSDPMRIWLEKGNRRLALTRRDLTFVPIMIEVIDLMFDSIQPSIVNGRETLDFSQPAFQVYKRNGMGFFFPSIPEEDPLDQYTYWHTPRLGDVVWDAGAYSGATTCLLALMVGPTGRVYAFEPDDLNFAYLEKNIAHRNPECDSGAQGAVGNYRDNDVLHGWNHGIRHSRLCGLFRHQADERGPDHQHGGRVQGIWLRAVVRKDGHRRCRVVVCGGCEGISEIASGPFCD